MSKYPNSSVFSKSLKSEERNGGWVENFKAFPFACQVDYVISEYSVAWKLHCIVYTSVKCR